MRTGEGAPPSTSWTRRASRTCSTGSCSAGWWRCWRRGRRWRGGHGWRSSWGGGGGGWSTGGWSRGGSGGVGGVDGGLRRGRGGGAGELGVRDPALQGGDRGVRLPRGHGGELRGRRPLVRARVPVGLAPRFLAGTRGLRGGGGRA